MKRGFILFASCRKLSTLQPQFFKMNYKNVFAGLVLAMIISGCGNSAGDKTSNQPAENETATTENNNQVPATVNTNQTTDTNNVTVNPKTELKVAPVTVPASVPATTTSKAGLNPEHGQPGHRCDIPVGSPLDSKPTTNTATNTTPISVQPQGIPATTSVVTPTVTQPAGTATTAPGMNPAHGQPGHRCDIPVGSPLNQPVKTGN